MPTIKPTYVAEPAYVSDAAERRQPVRSEHLERAMQLVADGTLLIVGAYDDMSASLLILDVDSEAEALAVIHEDVYWRSGVWTDVRIRVLNRVVGES